MENLPNIVLMKKVYDHKRKKTRGNRIGISVASCEKNEGRGFK
jgi:hypothetical protein